MITKLVGAQGYEGLAFKVVEQALVVINDADFFKKPYWNTEILRNQDVINSDIEDCLWLLDPETEDTYAEFIFPNHPYAFAGVRDYAKKSKAYQKIQEEIQKNTKLGQAYAKLLKSFEEVY